MQGGLEKVHPSKVGPSKVRRVTKQGGGPGGTLEPKKGKESIYMERKPGTGVLEPVEDAPECGLTEESGPEQGEEGIHVRDSRNGRLCTYKGDK